MKLALVAASVLFYSFVCILQVYFLYLAVAYFIRKRNIPKQRQILSSLGHPDPNKAKIVGFFHPYCNAGGGGERVLWVAVKSIQETSPNLVSIVYSGDKDSSKEQIISKVKSRFAIELDPALLHFVFLSRRHWVEDSKWPYFTLLGQSLGSIILAWEAFSNLIPDVFIDTMGYAFTFPLASLLLVPVGAYVHYPTISTTMLSRVRTRQATYANADFVSRSSTLSRAKLIYYRFFMHLYSFSLRHAAFVMVNSSWTKGHVDAILNHSDTLLNIILGPAFLLISLFGSSKVGSVKTSQIVYPSCDTREMSAFPLENREDVIVSLAQFRPEKDHATQLRSFQALLAAHPEYRERKLALVMIGGCRDEADAKRVENLKTLASQLGIEEHVSFLVNAPYSTVLSWLSRGSIGLSTMIDEHFGINIVEFMAAGMIPVTHASGGPFQDIVVHYDGQPTGYHATTPETFAEALHQVLSMSPEDRLKMRKRARAWAVEKFSEEEFIKGWEASGWRRQISV